MPVTHMIGGPRSGEYLVFPGEELTIERTMVCQPHPGGPTTTTTRVGRYRKYALVPTAAMWVGWDKSR